MRMFSAIICFVFIIFKTVVADLEIENPVVQLSCTNSTELQYTAVKNRPLGIILKDCNAKYMWCDNHYNSNSNVTFQEIINVESHNRTSMVTIPNVTNAMSTRWLCSILEDFHGPPTLTYESRIYTLIRRWFHLRVKGARSVKLSVNCLKLLPEETDLFDKEYDGVVSYFYRDGEIIDYECSCIEPSDTVQLKYYDSKGSLQFQTNIHVKETPYYFRSLFTTLNNNSYIVCILTTPSPQEEYYYKTIFIQQNPDSDTTSKDSAIQVSINELKLVPLPSSSAEDNYDRYQYKYVPGDVLNVTCEKRTQIRGKLDFSFSSLFHPQSDLAQIADGKVSVLLDTSRVSNKDFLEFHVKNTDVHKIFAKILFLSDLQGTGLRLRGLSPKNVEYQYNNGRDQWVIGYRYRAYETLSLTCVYEFQSSFYPEEILWMFGKDVIRSEEHNNAYNIRYITRNFTLEEMHNNSEITCKRSYTSKSNSVILNNIKKVKLFLHLQSDANSMDVEDNTDVGELVMILSAAFAVMVVIVTGVCLVCWCTRTKQAMLMQNAYENISNQNESPIPAFPSQWENQYQDSHYSQIDENAIKDDPAHSRDTKTLYTSPNMRKSKTPSENYYTEIDEYFKHNSVNLRNTTDFSYPTNSSANIIQEYHNSLYDSKDNIPTYDILRRSDLISSNSKIDNCDCDVSTSKASMTLRQNIDNMKPAGNKEANCSARGNKIKNDKFGLNACVKDKGDAYLMSNDVATKYEIILGQNDKDTNSLEYAEPYSDRDGVMCNNDFYN